MVAKQLFDQCGGLLTFSFIKDDMVYIKTTAFAPEIILGGDEVQKTTLHFRSDAVTLARADVFLCYGDTEIQVGVTDAAGDLTLCLSDGEFRFLVRDAERRYLILATAVQDGNKMEISLAADIDAAQEVTVTSVDSLGEGDCWTIAASGSQLRTARDGVSLGLRKGNPDCISVARNAASCSRHLRPHQHDLSICRRILENRIQVLSCDASARGSRCQLNGGNRLRPHKDHHNP